MCHTKMISQHDAFLLEVHGFVWLIDPKSWASKAELWMQCWDWKSLSVTNSVPVCVHAYVCVCTCRPMCVTLPYYLSHIRFSTLQRTHVCAWVCTCVCVYYITRPYSLSQIPLFYSAMCVSVCVRAGARYITILSHTCRTHACAGVCVCMCACACVLVFVVYLPHPPNIISEIHLSLCTCLSTAVGYCGCKN